jgi:hypothetical protein
MAKAYGKTYYVIARVVADAKARGTEDPIIWVSSERMKRRVEDIARAMGVEVKVEVSVSKWG